MSPDYQREIVGEGGPEARYLYALTDLDGDGVNEALIYLLGPYFCGSGGCDLFLLGAAEEGWTLIDRFPLSRLPVTASDEATEGWHDLIRLQSTGRATRRWSACPPSRNPRDGA